MSNCVIPPCMQALLWDNYSTLYGSSILNDKHRLQATAPLTTRCRAHKGMLSACMDEDHTVLIIRKAILLVEKAVKAHYSSDCNIHSAFRSGDSGTPVAGAAGVFEGGAPWVSVKARLLYHFFTGTHSPLGQCPDGAELTGTQLSVLFDCCSIVVPASTAATDFACVSGEVAAKCESIVNVMHTMHMMFFVSMCILCDGRLQCDLLTVQDHSLVVW